MHRCCDATPPDCIAKWGLPTSSPALVPRGNHLRSNKNITFGDVFHMQVFETESERRILRRCLYNVLRSDAHTDEELELVAEWVKKVLVGQNCLGMVMRGELQLMLDLEEGVVKFRLPTEEEAAMSMDLDFSTLPEHSGGDGGEAAS